MSADGAFIDLIATRREPCRGALFFKACQNEKAY
jgi:hypothetical protein